MAAASLAATLPRVLTLFKAAGTFEAGEEEGVWTTWHENGQKLREGAYKAGRSEGVWTWWNEYGNVTKTGTYKNGARVK